MNLTIECMTVLPVSNVLAEGIVWNEEQQAFWWTDIYGERLYRYKPEPYSDFDPDSLTHWTMQEPIGCFGFIEGCDKLMVASKSGIGIWTPGEGVKGVENAVGNNGVDSLAAKNGKKDEKPDVDSLIEFFGKPEQDRIGNRFNDGKVDPAGRFWAGGMVEDIANSPYKTGLYRVDVLPDDSLADSMDSLTSFNPKNLKVQKVMDDFHITNSLCWNKAGTKMYHADSPTMKLYSYDFDLASGTPSNKKLLSKTDGTFVHDGACTDVDGGIWVAHWQLSNGTDKNTRAKIIRYDTDGFESVIYEVPFSQCTCVAFGGPDMSWLMVTSAKHQLSPEQLKNEPMAGHVIIYRTRYRGVPIPRVSSRVQLNPINQ